MTSNFHIQRSIPKWGKNTYVNWTKTPQYKALVFIHGFNGSSMDTFGDFNLEFRFLPEYKGYDVFFFSYDSLYNQIANSALDFLDFLTNINNNLNQVILDSGATVERKNSYSKIVIVAHSLGAVVARQALNDGFDNDEQWIHNCELILFAPAHIGARSVIYSFMDFPGVLKFTGPLLRFFVLTIDQLLDRTIIIEPMTSKIYDLITNKKISSFTVAKKVFWAKPDRIVINRKFLQDPIATQFKGKKRSHQAVCKPDKNFREPFDELAKLL